MSLADIVACHRGLPRLYQTTVLGRFISLKKKLIIIIHLLLAASRCNGCGCSPKSLFFFLIKAPVRCLMRQNHFIKKKLIVPLRAAMGVPVSSVRWQINSIKKNIMIFHYSSPFALQRVWLFAEEFIFFLTKAARRCRCLGCFRELPPLWKICQERPPR